MMNAKWLGYTAAAGAFLAAGATTANSADFIYSTWVSAEHHLTKNVVVPFTKELEEKTNGAIKFKVYSGGSIAGGKETLGAIESGTADAGYVVDIYTPSELAQMAFISNLSLLIDDAVAATAAMNETVLLDCAECRASLEKHNVEPLGFISTSTYNMICTSPVQSLADLNGKKIRSSSAWVPLMGKLGAVAVNVPTSEMYEALQRGTIDCSVGPLSHLPSYSLYEVAKDVNTMPFGAYAGGLPLDLSKSAWDGLTAEQRRTVLDLVPKYVAAGIYGYIAEDKKAADVAKSKYNIKFLDPSKDLVDAYDAYKKDLLDEVIAKGAASKSVTNADKLVHTFADNLKKWKEIVAGLDGSEEAYAKALQEQIYSKLQ